MKYQHTFIKRFSKFLICFLLFQSWQVFGQTQQYLHFDREDDFIEVPAASQYISGAAGVSLTGWFYCDELAYGQGMFGFRNGGTGDGEMYLIQLNNGVLECRYITSSGFSEVVAPAFTVIPEVWQHYAWVYDGSQVILYLDGEVVGSSPSSSGPITSEDTPFGIGQLISPFDFNYGGRMDEVTVWSKGLSQAEIQDMIANELTGEEEGLELYYKFNQGVPGEDNTSISQAVSEVGAPDRNGNLLNFTLMGETSNFAGEVDNSFQAIIFPQISDKLVSDDPFELDAEASSGLDVSYTIVSGPAAVSENTVTLDGTPGEVIVRASQAGNSTFEPAEDVELSFMVLDPETFVPATEARSPLDGKEVWVPNLGPIPLASISNIGSPELFEITQVVFEIDGTMVEAKDWNNDHYTGWWTPPAYGTYTMNIISTNNYGFSSTESITFDVVNEMSNVSANAATDIHLNINVGEAIVSAELPCSVGAFDEIFANLTIDCPDGGCDPWDRISGIEVKGHNGEWYEIIRYITPYGLACNHGVDLTDFASLLHGKVDFRFYLGTQGNGFLYTLDFDYNGGVPTYAYSSVNKLWNDTYNFGDLEDLQPVNARSIGYPENAEASKIKLLSTGHGWGANNTNNAAEFNENTHHVHINGVETFTQNNWLDCDPNPDGCNDQFGTWYFDRAGWCPGAIAPWFDFDMTPFVGDGSVELEYVFDESYVDLCHANNPDCVSGVTCDNCNDGFNPHLIVASHLISLGNQPLGESVVVNANDLVNNIDFSIYPNPSKGVFMLELATEIDLKEIRILNNLGQILRVYNDQGNTNVRALHLEDFANGIYFVELHSNEGVFVRKIIKE